MHGPFRLQNLGLQVKKPGAFALTFHYDHLRTLESKIFNKVLLDILHYDKTLFELYIQCTRRSGLLDRIKVLDKITAAG